MAGRRENRGRGTERGERQQRETSPPPLGESAEQIERQELPRRPAWRPPDVGPTPLPPNSLAPRPLPRRPSRRSPPRTHRFFVGHVRAEGRDAASGFCTKPGFRQPPAPRQYKRHKQFEQRQRTLALREFDPLGAA